MIKGGLEDEEEIFGNIDGSGTCGNVGMAHTYDAFEAQNKKNTELIYSQGLALFLADAVTYLTGHVTKTDGNSIWITVASYIAKLRSDINEKV